MSWAPKVPSATMVAATEIEAEIETTVRFPVQGTEIETEVRKSTVPSMDLELMGRIPSLVSAKSTKIKMIPATPIQKSTYSSIQACLLPRRHPLEILMLVPAKVLLEIAITNATK